MMNDNVKSRFAGLLLLAAKTQTLKKAVFSKPKNDSVIRSVATLRNIAGKTVIQIESFRTDNKATHKNLSVSDETAEELALTVSDFRQVNLITSAGECEYRCSASGNEIIINENKLSRALAANPAEKVTVSGNDREKSSILNGGENFLIELGISDKNGRPHDKRLPKLRQINRFLEYVRDIEKYLPKDGALHICDLCCGKSYLSFAVYYYFSVIKGRDVVMTGVDLKRDCMEFCASAANSLGFSGLEFICANVAEYEPDVKPDLVVSLHACDTATDLVLGKAVSWNAKVILSTPCCHHEMNHNLNCPTLSFIAEHSMLRQKFCDAATDALRLKLLESEGYSVQAVELVDPDDTPKNILLRAVLTGGKNATAREEYETARAFLYGNAL